jgi:hypothetical protein
MTTITIDLPLDVIHELYRQAIACNTTIDEVVEKILNDYIERETKKVCTWKEAKSELSYTRKFETSCGNDIVRSDSIEVENEHCNFCGKKVRKIIKINPV